MRSSEKMAMTDLYFSREGVFASFLMVTDRHIHQHSWSMTIHNGYKLLQMFLDHVGHGQRQRVKDSDMTDNCGE